MNIKYGKQIGNKIYRTMQHNTWPPGQVKGSANAVDLNGVTKNLQMQILVNLAAGPSFFKL